MLTSVLYQRLFLMAMSGVIGIRVQVEYVQLMLSVKLKSQLDGAAYISFAFITQTKAPCISRESRMSGFQRIKPNPGGHALAIE